MGNRRAPQTAGAIRLKVNSRQKNDAKCAILLAWLLLVLGLAGSVVGCGSSAQQSSPADLEAAGKAIAEAAEISRRVEGVRRRARTRPTTRVGVGFARRDSD